jgi:hypothetical protein
MYLCPGKTCIPVKKSWYVPKAKVPGEEVTYCGICLSTGCNGIRKKKSTQLIEFVNAHCACPDPEGQHKHWLLEIDPVVCDNCKTRKFATSTEAVCASCGITSIDMSDRLCRYCSFAERRCYGCGVDETRWQKFQKQYQVSDALKEKFEARQLTAEDLPHLEYLILRNALAYQKGIESRGWE